MEPTSPLVLIRRKLTDGSLPHDSIPRVSGRPGNGEMCNACDKTIEKSEFVMEGVSTHSSERALQFHVGCLFVWDTERVAPGR